MSSDEKRFVAYVKIGNKAVQMPFHFTREKLEDVLSPHFDIQEIRDSFFYSKAVNLPALARFSILRNAAWRLSRSAGSDAAGTGTPARSCLSRSPCGRAHGR